MSRMIWAQDRRGVIGTDNTLPWHITEDSQRFRRLTEGSIVCMGRRTWDSLPEQYRPLPGRENWVLTHDPDWRADGAHVLTDLQEIVGHDAWIGGGAQVYAQALALADECWITDIDAEFPGDTYAPIPGPDWHLQPDHPEASDWRQSISAPVRYRYRVLAHQWRRR